MSPTPTDVSYRTANAMDRGPAHANAPGPVKGLREDHMGVSVDNRASRLNGNASHGAQALPTGGTGNGVGPGNMSSGISVQELKQMTALRMAQEQGHLRVVSPFSYGEDFSRKGIYDPGFYVEFGASPVPLMCRLYPRASHQLGLCFPAFHEATNGLSVVFPPSRTCSRHLVLC